MWELNKDDIGDVKGVLTLLVFFSLLTEWSIMEGLALWKNNVNKRFEGVEDCMICFLSHSVSTILSSQKPVGAVIPKKFHSACLVLNPKKKQLIYIILY